MASFLLHSGLKKTLEHILRAFQRLPIEPLYILSLRLESLALTLTRTVEYYVQWALQSGTDTPEICAPKVSVQLDAAPRSEKTGAVEKGTESLTEDSGVSDEARSPKKSWSFHLAFVGLATGLFVFQVDATCLGIALPVSHEDASFCPKPIPLEKARPIPSTYHSR